MAASSLDKCFLTGDFFSSLHMLKMGILSKKESHSFSSNTVKETKRNLNRAVETKFNVLKYFLILNKFGFYSNIPSSSVLPWQESIWQSSFSMF